MATWRETMAASLLAWTGETALNTTVVDDAIGDSIEALWEAMMLVQISRFLGDPVDATFAAGDDLVDLTAGQGNPITNQSIAYIRNLAVRTSEGGLRTLEQVDIDSCLMRQLARAPGATQEGQLYAWDLINGTHVAIKPKPGLELNVTYLFVLQPSRASTTAPFTQAGADAFIRYNSLSLVALSMDEYPRSTAWEKKADREVLAITRALLKQSAQKNRTIRPYMG